MCAAAGVVLACANPVGAQNAAGDPVLAGYLRLYAGDADEAVRHFETLRARDAQSLATWFGHAFTQFARVQADDSLAGAFEADLDALIALAEARYARSRADTEALFYLSHAYMLRGAYRASADKGLFGAARDAARAKGHAEQYIKRHPEHGDAYLTLGIYNYYAGIAPTFVKVVRVLLLLPGGNRTEGLAQIERTAREGSLLAPLAQGLLGAIYGTVENRLEDAIAVGEALARRFPGNAFVRLTLAEVYEHPTVEAFDRAAAQYAAVMDRATTPSLQHVADRHRAVLGMAGLRRSQWRLDEAVALLTPVIDRPLAKPAWVLPAFLLRRANYRMLLNDRGASEDCRRVLADPAMAKSHRAARRQAAAIADWFRSGEAALYASLIPGNRLVAEDRWDEARAVYGRGAAAHPGSWQIRYRLAVLDFARADYAAAARQFDAIVTARARMPDWLKANALIHLAWTHDLAGRRAEAVRLYKQVVDDYEDEAPAGSARIGLLSPYRGPIRRLAVGSRD